MKALRGKGGEKKKKVMVNNSSGEKKRKRKEEFLVCEYMYMYCMHGVNTCDVSE